MRLNSRCALRDRILPLLSFLGVAAIALAAGERVRLTPHFAPGTALRYRIDTSTTTTGTTKTPIADPEGGTKSRQAIHLLVRLDVLDPAPAAAPGAIRMRATYEKSSAESESDAFEPEAPSLSDQYARAEGRSVEFTLDPSGQLSDAKGLEDVFPRLSPADPLLSWAPGISAGAGLPQGGVSIGQTWKSERPLEGMPLAGLTWRTTSTYLRNEPCPAAGPATGAGNRTASHSEECAVVLTRLAIFRSGPSDATPPDYRRNGLRTSGTWTGSGESLDSISLATCLLVSSTQTSTQDMDYEITSTSSGSSVHRKGHIESHSEIALIPDQK